MLWAIPHRQVSSISHPWIPGTSLALLPSGGWPAHQSLSWSQTEGFPLMCTLALAQLLLSGHVFSLAPRTSSSCPRATPHWLLLGTTAWEGWRASLNPAPVFLGESFDPRPEERGLRWRGGEGGYQPGAWRGIAEASALSTECFQDAIRMHQERIPSLWNKPDRERQILHGIAESLICGIFYF